uniref:Reverse transcriptase Ty1/copia-type domain-containing protein n=1 Tax=Tanacetum cinerariifolium TaxID=118510 RepID=A0A6L2M5J7_TANCI|nr:hypothetical protein [Tanacetum cinerariifolium]
MGYEDYQTGNVMISRVYFVEGLEHNLFSIGQFCDSNLEVAFCQHIYFIHNLEGIDLLIGSRGNNLYTRSLEDMMASSLISRHGLVRGLLKLKFKKDHLCSACAMGKSKKKPYKPKSKDTNQEKLYLLHMDLCGPMCIAIVNGKKYILVIVDDYSRFTWVKFLRSKDEAPNFIIKFLKMIQVGISHETSVARSPQQNGVVERRNRTLIKAARTISSEPALHEMTLATISLGLVPNPPPSTPFVPPSRTKYNILFQPLFDELLNPPPSVDLPAPEVITPITEVVAPEPTISTGSPSSTTGDQDEPSTSDSQTTSETQSPVIPNDIKEDNHDLDVAHMNNDPFFGIPILKNDSEASYSSDDHPLDNIISELERHVSTRLQLHEQALFCYYDAFLTSVKPKKYKDALTQACWIKAMQEELNEFECLEVQELVLHPDKVMTVFLNGILHEEVYISQPDEFLDQDNPNHVYRLKKALYGLKQVPRAWYDLLLMFLLSQGFSKGTVDPTLFNRRQGKDILLAKPTEKHLHAIKRIFKHLRRTVNRGHWYLKDYSIALIAYADAVHAGCQDTRRSTFGSMQFLGDKVVSWSSKRQKSAVISSMEAEYIALSGYCAQVLWMR